MEVGAFSPGLMSTFILFEAAVLLRNRAFANTVNFIWSGLAWLCDKDELLTKVGEYCGAASVWE
ncbi:MAG: hypothetical protein H7240_03795 [Glaciimonas sp.]|nr:hypothetical protein [Glaciimonas sp.]